MASKDLNKKSEYTIPLLHTFGLLCPVLQSYQLRHDDCVATCQVVERENKTRIARAEASISSALEELNAFQDLALARETAEAKVQDARDRLAEVKAKALRKETQATTFKEYVWKKFYDYMEKLVELDTRVESVVCEAAGVPTNKDARPRVEIPVSTAACSTTNTESTTLSQSIFKIYMN